MSVGGKEKSRNEQREKRVGYRGWEERSSSQAPPLQWLLRQWWVCDGSENEPTRLNTYIKAHFATSIETSITNYKENYYILIVLITYYVLDVLSVIFDCGSNLQMTLLSN